MSQSFEIKECLGKGLGVFATHDLIAGECVMKEKPIAFINNKHAHDIIDSDVEEVFSTISKTEKEAFLALWEGSRSLQTKRLRIYRSNCFKWDNDNGKGFGACISLQLSRLNHSCLPNAAWRQEHNYFRVFALRPISKGEEITVCYNQDFFWMIAVQRKALQDHIYKFSCDCKACDTNTEFSRASDKRRTRIGLLHFRLQGLMVPSFCLPPPGSSNTSASMPLGGSVAAHPGGLLERWSDSAVQVQCQLAELLQAEGLLGVAVAGHYDGAANALCEQLPMYVKSRQPIPMIKFENILKWKRQALAMRRTYMMKEEYQPYEDDLAIFQSFCTSLLRGTMSAQVSDK